MADPAELQPSQIWLMTESHEQHVLSSMSYEKPPGLTSEYGAQFQDRAAVKAYKYREPYPNETFDVLYKLAGTLSPQILDLGCGTGDISIGLSQFSARIDAIDLSEQMIDEARRSYTGICNINWICDAVENRALDGPYDLIVAADSVHWMDWQILFHEMRRWLKTGKYFCVVGRWYENANWWDHIWPIKSMRTTIGHRMCTSKEWELQLESIC